jgi:hypothetical protein
MYLVLIARRVAAVYDGSLLSAGPHFDCLTIHHGVQAAEAPFFGPGDRALQRTLACAADRLGLAYDPVIERLSLVGYYDGTPATAQGSMFGLALKWPCVRHSRLPPWPRSRASARAGVQRTVANQRRAHGPRHCALPADP